MNTSPLVLFHCLFAFALVSLLSNVDATMAAETNRQITDECGVQSTRVDRTADGPVDYKVFFVVTNATAKPSVTVECDHRSVGSKDWLLRIYSIGTNLTSGADNRLLVSAAILLAADSLPRDYDADPIAEVCLEPLQMPRAFSVSLYSAVREKMRRVDSTAKRFDDPQVRQMVKDTYREMGYVQYVKTRLEEGGFRVTVDVAELCCLKRSVEGMPWKAIADLPAVGLNMGSVTCCLGLARTAASR